MYETKKIGKKYSTSFSTYISQDGKTISPFHDIPLVNGEFFNVVNEIPRFENGKFEICKNEKLNPIKQDIKKGNVRFVSNIFPSKGYLWNYGALPQTWEDPNKKDEWTNEFGDNDPIDVLEIGSKQKNLGEVYTAKVLGCIALIDSGECDWKIIVIDVEDEKSKIINDVFDIDSHFPGLLKLTVEWFRDYKIPNGSPINNFAFEGRIKDAEFAKNVIKIAHESWKTMMNSDVGKDISKDNATLSENSHFMREDYNVSGVYDGEEECPSIVNEYFFIK